MLDIQKEIEELDKIAYPEKYYSEHLPETTMWEREVAKKAILIIGQLQEEIKQLEEKLNDK